MAHDADRAGGAAQEYTTPVSSDVVYEVYVVDCRIEWGLPEFEEPRLRRNTGETYPLSDLPGDILDKRNHLTDYVTDGVQENFTHPADREPIQPVQLWRFLAAAADTVFYVGESENPPARVRDYRNDDGSKFMESATVVGLVYRNPFEQNLRTELLEKLETFIPQLERRFDRVASTPLAEINWLDEEPAIPYTEEGVAVPVAELQAWRDEIRSEAFVSRSDIATWRKAWLTRWTDEFSEQFFPEATAAPLQNLLDEAKAERRTKEEIVATELMAADYHTDDQGDRRLDIENLKTFAFWG